MRCSCDPGDKLTTVCPHRADFPDPPGIHCPCSCGDCDSSCDTQREVGASKMDPRAWEIVGIERVEGVDGSMGWRWSMWRWHCDSSVKWTLSPSFVLDPP